MIDLQLKNILNCRQSTWLCWQFLFLFTIAVYNCNFRQCSSPNRHKGFIYLDKMIQINTTKFQKTEYWCHKRDLEI